MPACFFASDLHGRTDRYDKLFAPHDGPELALVLVRFDPDHPSQAIRTLL